MTNILSIQSHVAYGHAGNSAAVLPLQRLGIDVWPVLTVNFSNHTGYGVWRGPTIAADDVWEVVRGIDDRGVLSSLDALLTGYQGSADVGAVILKTADLVRSRNPDAVYCCDPVMGDVGRGFYARPGIPEFMRDWVVPVADVMTPNLFELEFLTGNQTRTIGDVVAAAHVLRQRGPETVLVTSVVETDSDERVMRMLAVDSHEVWQVETPLLDRDFTGSGDLTTSMFLAHLLGTGNLGQALSATASIVYSVLAVTTSLDSLELAIVAAQDEVVAPRFSYQATKL